MRRCSCSLVALVTLLVVAVLFWRLSMVSRILSVDYEVFGRVQGVFFRKYTQKKAQELGIRGWVRNTRQDTVVGVIQGHEQPFQEMKRWLQHEGSPHSRIDKCQFNNERVVDDFEFNSFEVRH